ncbi:MAG TPA: type II toxin-antitoxin system HicB family antitoxin [Bryobacteraceae bacterium]|nr:type II toxin-antitoxin system HicB family antitoxin [Bryobacteraceae bacterium]
MLRYAVKLRRENGRVLVSFPDFPNVHTFGDDEPDALARGIDALETMLAAMIDDKDEIPEPRPVRRRRSVVLPALTEAKIGLYREMRSSGIGKAALARRLRCHLPQIDRLLDLRHASRLEQLEQAFIALGKRIGLSIENAA